MITEFQVQGYKALKGVTLALTPIHVLIGPNDSGKTSILEAIQALCRSADFPLSEAFAGVWSGLDLVWQNLPEVSVTLRVVTDSGLGYCISASFGPTGRSPLLLAETASGLGGSTHSPARRLETMVSSNMRAPAQYNLPKVDQSIFTQAHQAISGVEYYRWNPRFLSLPNAPDSSRRFRMESSGFGLTLCLDDILGFERDRFVALENRFRKIFPDIKSIKLLPEPAYRSPVDSSKQIPILQQADGKGLYFEFISGRVVPAAQVSDGILLVLAYLTILHLPQPPRVILIEEPENGIHPNRLKEVLGILRDLIKEQTHTQIVMTTHSPYVLDLFQPGEVTLCEKGADGAVRVHRLSESKLVRDQKDVFNLGEIWTAEGDEKIAASASPGAGSGQ